MAAAQGPEGVAASRLPGYVALRESAAWAEVPGCTVLTARGRDAVRFLDGFVTASVARLEPGTGTEAFFTDVRGRVIAPAVVLREQEGLLIMTSAGMGERLHGHLEHHHIREDVTLADVSHEATNLVVAGPHSHRVLASVTVGQIPDGVLRHGRCAVGGVDAVVVRIERCGPVGFLIRCPKDEVSRIADALEHAGAVRADASTVDAIRIEEGVPEAADVDDKALPQELGRDARAISFTKGCYLGQETVARIDALGHVNRRLVGLSVPGGVPVVGTAVEAGSETVGRISSACWSPRLGTGLGMAILPRKYSDEGADVRVGGVSAVVVMLPIPAPASVERAGMENVMFEGRRFRVVRVEEPLDDGPPRSRDVVLHPGSVVILPLVSSDEVCLIDVARIAVGARLLELPAGTLDREESIADAAARELMEETGYRAGSIEPVGALWMSPGILRERMHLFVARHLEAGPQALEPGESITTRVVPWDEAVAMCLDGRIEDAKTVAAILRFDGLRRTGG